MRRAISSLAVGDVNPGHLAVFQAHQRLAAVLGPFVCAGLQTYAGAAWNSLWKGGDAHRNTEDLHGQLLTILDRQNWDSVFRKALPLPQSIFHECREYRNRVSHRAEMSAADRYRALYVARVIAEAVDKASSEPIRDLERDALRQLVEGELGTEILEKIDRSVAPELSSWDSGQVEELRLFAPGLVSRNGDAVTAMQRRIIYLVATGQFPSITELMNHIVRFDPTDQWAEFGSEMVRLGLWGFRDEAKWKDMALLNQQFRDGRMPRARRQVFCEFVWHEHV